MRKYLLICIAFLFVVLLTALPYLLKKNRPIDIWDFVPNSSAIVFESKYIFGSLESLKFLRLWSSLSKIVPSKSVVNKVEMLEGVVGQDLGDLLDGTDFIITTQVTSNTDFDFLFIKELPNKTAFDPVESIKQYTLKNQYVIESRKYLKYTINEIGTKNGNFSYTIHGGYFIGSFSALLVEDAIRSFESGNRNNYLNKNKRLNKVVKLKKDQGDLYIRKDNFIKLIKLFFPNASPDIGESIYLDFKLHDNFIEFNGFTFPDEDESTPLNVHKTIEPGNFDIGEVIPLQTSLVMHHSFSDKETFKANYSKYILSDTIIGSLWDTLQSNHNFPIQSIFDLLNEEMALLQFENPNQIQKALVLKVEDEEKAVTIFDELSKKISPSNQLYSEYYKNKMIRLLIGQKLPLCIWGKGAEGFGNSYYFEHKNYIIFTNTLVLAKEIITSIQDENTWFTLSDPPQFLSEINKSANLTIYYKINDMWQSIISNTKENHHIFFENNIALKDFNDIVVQYSQVDNCFYTHVAISQLNSEERTQKTAKVSSIYKCQSKLIRKPELLEEMGLVVVQDANFNIHGLNKTLEHQWSRTLGDRITGGIFEIDFFGNGNYQMAFITENKLHIMDKFGNDIGESPKEISYLDRLRNFNIIDYDGSKSYRFSFSDGRQSVILSNKSAQVLNGWDPLSVPNSPSTPLTHFRIGNKDIMVLTLLNGQVNLFNRRGQNLSGFPINLEGVSSSEYHLTNQGTLDRSHMTFVMDNGQLTRINLLGDILSNKQLNRGSPDAKFTILNNQRSTGYLVSSWDNNSWRIMNQAGEILFSKQYLELTETYQQFFQVTASKEVIVFGHADKGNAYFYDLSGNPLTYNPIKSDHPIDLKYSYKNDTMVIYAVFENELRLLDVN